MLAEIMFSGLCVVESMTGGTSAAIHCPAHGGTAGIPVHQVRLVVEARQIESWPTGHVADWVVGADGLEYASFDLAQAVTFEFLKADGTTASQAFSMQLKGLVRAKELGLTPVKDPKWGTTFSVPDGALEATRPITDGNGHEACFEKGSLSARGPLMEDVVWSHDCDVLKVRFADGKTMRLKPAGASSIRVGLSNDVKSISKLAGGEHDLFDHWQHVKPLHGQFVAPELCGTGKAATTTTLTANRPICNLIALD